MARVVVDLAAAQVRAGWDVVVACPPDGRLPAAASSAGASVVPWRASREVGMWAAGELVRLHRVIGKVLPDLIHLHSAKAGLVGRLALRGSVPTVFQPHAWSFDAVSGPMRLATLSWERFATRWAHSTVCVSAYEADAGARVGVRGPGAVVPNGIDLDRFGPQDDAARVRARNQLGLAHRPTAVCVGRLCPQKGQDRLLSVWPRIRAAVPDAELVLVGDGPQLPALSAMAAAGVRFAGAVADPRPWYAAADVVALPSRWEGMALVQLEAQASARCVVATDVGGAREVLPPGSTAVVPVNDLDALADALVARLTRLDVATAEAAAGRAHVCADYDLRQATARMHEVYRALLVGRPLGGQTLGGGRTLGGRP